VIADRSFVSAEVVADPYPYLRALRSEDPVHWSDHHKAWVLTRYDDVSSAFLDERLSSARVRSLLPIEPSEDEREAFAPIVRLLGSWMVFTDPPDHARLRRLARAAFSGRMVERLRPAVEAVVDRLIADIERERRDDFVAAFAYPLPANVIAALLGVPPADHKRFEHWCEEIAPLVFGGHRTRRRDRALESLVALEKYFRHLLDRYREEPSDNLLSAFATARCGPPFDRDQRERSTGDASLARAEEKGDVLSADEVIGNCVLLLFAGLETTANLLGTGVLHLDRHPDEKRRLIENPRLAPIAVEELLRYDGPSKMQGRIAAEDVEIRGRRIAAGDRVLLCQAAANRDPDRFADPDRLDLGREDNEHLAFGLGMHYCLGAPLARLEAEIAFVALTTRLPNLRVAADSLEWHASVLGRGLKSLPIVA
jgi:cytochrome P450